MKIVYFGTDVFLSSFLYLAEHEEILALYTVHNDEDYFSEYAIVREAEKRNIPVFYGRICEEQVRAYFLEQQCDLFFSAEYGYIIPVPEELENFRGVNVHNSLLPEGQGYYPVECAMECGLPASGVTMHKIARELDSGAILFQERIVLTPEMDSVDVYLECSRHVLNMTRCLVRDFESYWAAAREQIPPFSHWKKPEAAQRTISHCMTNEAILDRVRRYNQMTLVELEGKLRFLTAVQPGCAALASDVVPVSENRYLYRTKNGHVRLQVLPEK